MAGWTATSADRRSSIVALLNAIAIEKAATTPGVKFHAETEVLRAKLEVEHKVYVHARAWVFDRAAVSR